MKIYLKPLFRRNGKFMLLGMLMHLLPSFADAQIIELSGQTTGEFSSNEQIRLLPGFHTNGPFHAFITKYLNLPLISFPNPGYNYVRIRTVRKAGADSEITPNINDMTEVMQYYDDLGRPLQTIQTMASPRGKDIVQQMTYDAFGRQQFQYLPYASNDAGIFHSNAANDVFQYYSSSSWDTNVMRTGAPFGKTIFEASPMNRINEQGTAGTVWQPAVSRTNTSGRTIMMSYSSNDDGTSLINTGYAVRLWRAVQASGPTYQRDLSNAGYYNPGELYLKITKDENWVSTDGKTGTVEEYTDKEGRVVLKRSFNSGNSGVEVLSTYYVYDDLGNLSFVLPPAANPDGGAISQTVLDQFCYQYRYDEKQRLIEKRIPGTDDWTTIVYNLMDQVVFTQDALQRQNQQTSFTKYDGLGRIVMTGIGLNSTETRAFTQNVVNNWPSNWEHRDNNEFQGYSNTAAPSTIANMDVKIVNYYDDYDITGIPVNESASYSNKTQGLLTATKVQVLGTANYLWTINYYDEEGRIAKQYQQHYQSGAVNAGNYDEITNTYNFEGVLTASTRVHHNVAGAATTIANRYEYDHIGRKLRTYEKINTDAEVLLAENRYNEIGQLRSKVLHNGAQTTNYSYNERGWLKTGISNQFSYQLNYQDGTVPQFNGNISEQLWGTSNASGNGFSYGYDKLNRLTSGLGTGMSEVITGYDLMGNIQGLRRQGSLRSYSYSGNRLSSTNGAEGLWTNQYDANGNMIFDGRLGQAVTYNILNLPASVPGIGLSYVYDATGNKLKKVSGSNVTDYVNGILYSNGAIDFIQTEAGVARRNGSGYNYEYNLTDHLGNVRYTFYLNPVTRQIERLQSDDYFPFGLRKSSGSPVSLNNKYLYNGKEIQDELLGDYDYGARFYDPVIGRWNVVDPLAEQMRRYSPYNYVFNNPMRFIDPDGMKGQDWYQSSDNTTVKWIEGSGEQQGYTHLGPTAQLVSSGENGGTVNLNADGTATNATTGEFAATSVSGQTAIEDKLSGTLNSAGIAAGSAGLAGDIGGYSTASFRLTNGAYNGSEFSPRLYGSGWGGGSRAQITTYSASNLAKGISFGAGVAGTALSYYQISSGRAQPITYVDAGVGTAGIIASGASYFTGAQIPYVGEAVMVYGATRLLWDISSTLGGSYGPSKWFGKDDTKYFK